MIITLNEKKGKMKSITLHGVDKQLAELIESKAESEGLSINKTIKKMLETSQGVKPQDDKKNSKDFEELCGLWTKDDLDEFKNTCKTINKLNA